MKLGQGDWHVSKVEKKILLGKGTENTAMKPLCNKEEDEMNTNATSQ